MPDTGQLRKMTEKFQRDAERDAEEDVAKRVFEWPSTPGAGAIKIIYHYGDDRVTASFRRLGSGLG